MNDDLVVQKISKLLQNNTSFIGYALNGGIGTKINVRNTETGKTIQALSINVDSSGEVLVVKDSADGQYKAVTFKTAEKVSERIIQLRKTKPIDDKKTIEYTDSDIEVFYLFVKLIDTGSPVTSQLTSTWIRKGTSCTEFVGAYERCNYARRETIGGTSYTGLPYTPYASLNECLNDDNGPDAKTPHGSKDENGGNAGWRYFSTKVSADGEASMLNALTSHDNNYGTNMKKLFGYGSILECSGAMNLQGWEIMTNSTTGVPFFNCEFSYLPGYTTDCTPAMQAAGYCDQRGFISSKAPLLGQEAPGQPSVGNVDNSWGHQYGWATLPYEFMYKRHFGQQYLNGSTAPGGFYILEVNEDQVPSQLPPNYFPWVPGCPSGGTGGPYDGSGGGRSPDDAPPIQKRDMKLSTHKAEIWLGSSKKEEAIKLYELGVSDLFSGMYNATILPDNESQVDIKNRINGVSQISEEDQFYHDTFQQNKNKNIIDLRIDPRVWMNILNNSPYANYIYPSNIHFPSDIKNDSLQVMVDNLYNRTVNLTIIDKNTQVVHLKLGLTPRNILSNTECSGNSNGSYSSGQLPGQSWQYQKNVTIKIKNWAIESTTNNLDTTGVTWNKNYIEKQYFTSFGRNGSPGVGYSQFITYNKDFANNILLQSTSDININNLLSGNNFEQYNYTQQKTFSNDSILYFVSGSARLNNNIVSGDSYRGVMLSTNSWWALWDKAIFNSQDKRLSSIVGFDFNFHQILTNWGLSPSLDYNFTSNPSYNNRELSAQSYWCYAPDRPKVYIPSVIRSVRNKLLSNSFTANNLLISRDSILNTYGTLFYFTYRNTKWAEVINFSRNDIYYLPVPSSFYKLIDLSNYTKEYILSLAVFVGEYRTYSPRRFEVYSWLNYLWTQFIYDGTIKVDVDSYKDVDFNLPSNPSKYIKFAVQDFYANSEYNFILQKDQTLETVLSPGTLDVTKQVPIKKPTNVELDPNMSFLLYLYPYVKVTKKTKEI